MMYFFHISPIFVVNVLEWYRFHGFAWSIIIGNQRWIIDELWFYNLNDQIDL